MTKNKLIRKILQRHLHPSKKTNQSKKKRPKLVLKLRNRRRKRKKRKTMTKPLQRNQRMTRKINLKKQHQY